MYSSKMIKKVQIFIIRHKIISGVILIGAIIGIYFIIKNNLPVETRYVTTIVKSGDIISSVSGSGQVEASSSIDLKAKFSGTISGVFVKSGAFVRKGQTLFALDAKDAEKALRDANLNLEIAKNDLENSRISYENTKTSQELSLKSLLLTLNSAVTAVPDQNNTNTNITTLSGIYDSSIQGEYIIEAYTCQEGSCINYSGLESGSFAIDLNVPKQLGTRGLYINFSASPLSYEKWYVSVPSPNTSSYLSNLRAYTEKKESAKQAIESASQTVVTKELTVKQKENILIDAKQMLSDYYITAPFDGTIANILGKVGDIASGTLATIITKQKVAEISLNEVDVAKVKLGQKATLTFDAIPEISITGIVAQIDSISTVSQGVVTYIVTIALDKEEAQILPRMSVSADIITDSKQNVFLVPNSAVKTQASASYVEMFDMPLPVPLSGAQGSISAIPPRKQMVEIGISNDTMTEIISGLKEGDEIVTKTIASTVAKPATTAPSIFGATGTGNRNTGTPRVR